MADNFTLELYRHEKEVDSHFFRFNYHGEVQFWFSVEESRNSIYTIYVRFTGGLDTLPIPKNKIDDNLKQMIDHIAGYIYCNEVYYKEVNDTIFWATANNISAPSFSGVANDAVHYAHVLTYKALVLRDVYKFFIEQFTPANWRSFIPDNKA